MPRPSCIKLILLMQVPKSLIAPVSVMQRDSDRADCVRKAQGVPCLGKWSSALQSENLSYRLNFRIGAGPNCRSSTQRLSGLT
jgi:hypothetical protein